MPIAQREASMNQYGRRAQRYWQEWRPQEYAAMTNPDSFFSQWGETAQNQVEELTASLAGQDVPDETYLEKLGRLNMAKLQAEEAVFAELPQPEASQSEAAEGEETEADQPETSASDQGWIPLTEDPSHPFWQEN